MQLPHLVAFLKRFGAHPCFLRWIAIALRLRRCALRCGQWLSPWRSITMALPQGSALSSVCFNAYSACIATPDTRPDTSVLTVADDVVILSTSQDRPDAVTKALGLNINPQKVKSCLSSTNPLTRWAPTFTCEGVVVPSNCKCCILVWYLIRV